MNGQHFHSFEIVPQWRSIVTGTKFAAGSLVIVGNRGGTTLLTWTINGSVLCSLNNVNREYTKRRTDENTACNVGRGRKWLGTVHVRLKYSG